MPRHHVRRQRLGPILTKTLNLGKDFCPRRPISGPCRGLFCVVFCNFAYVKALCPAPLMQNYMIKSVKMTKKSIFREQFSWKVRNFSHTRSYFRSKAQRKTRFPLVLCSLIRNFAQNLCENGLHLGKERALCTRFAPSLQRNNILNTYLI